VRCGKIKINIVLKRSEMSKVVISKNYCWHKRYSLIMIITICALVIGCWFSNNVDSRKDFPAQNPLSAQPSPTRIPERRGKKDIIEEIRSEIERLWSLCVKDDVMDCSTPRIRHLLSYPKKELASAFYQSFITLGPSSIKPENLSIWRSRVEKETVKGIREIALDKKTFLSIKASYMRFLLGTVSQQLKDNKIALCVLVVAACNHNDKDMAEIIIETIDDLDDENLLFNPCPVEGWRLLSLMERMPELKETILHLGCSIGCLEIVDYVIENYHKDPEDYQRYLFALKGWLKKFGSDNEICEKVYNFILSLFEKADENSVLDAFDLIDELNMKGFYDVLKRYYLKDKRKSVRRYAAQAMLSVNPKESVPIICERVRNADTLKEAVEWASLLWGGLDKRRYASLLIVWMGTHKDIKYRGMLWGYARIGATNRHNYIVREEDALRNIYLTLYAYNKGFDDFALPKGLRKEQLLLDLISRARESRLATSRLKTFLDEVEAKVRREAREALERQKDAPQKPSK